MVLKTLCDQTIDQNEYQITRRVTMASSAHTEIPVSGLLSKAGGWHHYA